MIGNIDILVKELCKLPKEVGWIEFKHNNCEPNMIGEDISALANTATLNDRDYAYMIWGVDDTTHEIIGTKEGITSAVNNLLSGVSWYDCSKFNVESLTGHICLQSGM